MRGRRNDDGVGAGRPAPDGTGRELAASSIRSGASRGAAAEVRWRMNPRVTAARPLGGHRLELKFTDGLNAEVDLRDQVVGRGGVFTDLEDPDYFASVRVDPEAGTLVWPNGVDLCPDVLYSLASGRSIPSSDIGARVAT